MRGFLLGGKQPLQVIPPKNMALKQDCKATKYGYILTTHIAEFRNTAPGMRPYSPCQPNTAPGYSVKHWLDIPPFSPNYYPWH